MLKMKLLFVNANIVNGGAEKMMVWLSGFMARKHEVSFLTYRDNAEDFHDLDERVKRIKLNSEASGANIGQSLKTIAEIRKLVKKEKYDAAIAFLSPSQLRLAFACAGTKTKLLFSHRGDPTRNADSKSFVQRLNAFAFSKADFYVFQTEGAKACFDDKIKARSRIIPNPIFNLTSCTDVIKRDKRIVNVARLDKMQKRQDILIEAFNKFCKYNDEYTLDLYGDGPDEAELCQMARGNDRIAFHGAVRKVVEEIKSASMFVLTSDFEGIPNALMEAMALGLPCISTDCTPGGAALLIKNGVNGILVPCGDADALCDAMRFYADNKDLAEQYGTEAKKVLIDFSEEKIGNMWLDVIENML